MEPNVGAWPRDIVLALEEQSRTWYQVRGNAVLTGNHERALDLVQLWQYATPCDPCLHYTVTRC